MTSIPGFGPHVCVDSRLSCVDCNAQVCPKCMVQCPVGNRCPKCAGKFTSHVLEVSPMVVARTLAVAALIGGLFSLTGGGFSFGFYGWIITYVMGIFAGNIIHKAASFKLGRKVLATVSIGVIGGAVSVNALLAPSVTPSPSLAGMHVQQAGGRSTADSSNAYAEAAAALAQKRWTEFEESYKAHKGSEFAVEVPFRDGSNTESMWVTVSNIAGEDVSGKLANVPVKIHSVKSGDNVTVKKADIGDWLYKDGANYVGGFRVAALRARDENAEEYAAFKAMEQEAGVGYSSFFGFYIKLAIFVFGVFTPILGIIPPIRLPWLRW